MCVESDHATETTIRVMPRTQFGITLQLGQNNDTHTQKKTFKERNNLIKVSMVQSGVWATRTKKLEEERQGKEKHEIMENLGGNIWKKPIYCFS